MITPAVYLGFLLSSALGLGFHLVRGSSLSRLMLYLCTSWVSFFVGHRLGEWIEWHTFRLGAINLLPALLASIIGLLTASILAGSDSRSKTRRRK